MDSGLDSMLENMSLGEPAKQQEMAKDPEIVETDKDQQVVNGINGSIEDIERRLESVIKTLSAESDATSTFAKLLSKHEAFIVDMDPNKILKPKKILRRKTTPSIVNKTSSSSAKASASLTAGSTAKGYRTQSDSVFKPNSALHAYGKSYNI